MTDWIKVAKFSFLVIQFIFVSNFAKLLWKKEIAELRFCCTGHKLSNNTFCSFLGDEITADYFGGSPRDIYKVKKVTPACNDGFETEKAFQNLKKVKSLKF